jgi:hypothetical protein
MASPSSVAQLAAQHVELAINTLVEVMRAARRNDQHRVAAARVILDLAGAAAVGDTWESKPPPSLDELAAARERLRRARDAEQHWSPLPSSPERG